MAKPELKLVGEDGNAFAILGKAVRVARTAGWSQEEIQKFQAEATSGNYDNLLFVCQKYFDVF